MDAQRGSSRTKEVFHEVLTETTAIFFLDLPRPVPFPIRISFRPARDGPHKYPNFNGGGLLFQRGKYNSREIVIGKIILPVSRGAGHGLRAFISTRGVFAFRP